MAPVRLGLIGAGRWGQVYLRTIASMDDRCCLTHLGTSHPERAALLPYPVSVEPDWRRVVGAGCDAVIIASPAQTHAQIVEACLDAGKPCIIEKPWCTDLETAERLHAAILDAGALVLVDHTPVFSAAFQALKAHLRQSQEPVRAILAERVGTEWPRRDLPVVWEWGPHDVSLCLDLLDEFPEAVDALAGPAGPAGLPGTITMRLEFAGASGWIHTGWLAPGKRRELTVVTDERIYRLDELAEQQLTVAPLQHPEFRRTLNIPDSRPAMAVMLSYFLDGLAGGDRTYFGSELALRVTRVLAACEKCQTRSEVPGTSQAKCQALREEP